MPGLKTALLRALYISLAIICIIMTIKGIINAKLIQILIFSVLNGILWAFIYDSFKQKN